MNGLRILGFIGLVCLSAAAVAAESVAPKAAEPMNISDFKGKSGEELDRMLKSEIVYRASLGRADDVQLLLDHGASANEISAEGTPVLSLAAARLDAEALAVAKLLLQNGANINAKDKKGQNALFHAVRSGTLDMLQLLLASKIDYYAADNKGAIARNLAYDMNRKEFADAMDEFVRAEGERIRKQYEAFNQTVSDRDKQQALSREEQAAQEKAILAAEQAVIHAKHAKHSSPEFKSALENLSYSNCAFQYWSYVRVTKQKSELSETELDAAIDAQRQQIESIIHTLVDEYAVYGPYIDMLSDKSKQLIFAKIDNMPSKIERFQQGIGKSEDMKTRCTDISKHWKEMPVEKKKDPTPARRPSSLSR